MQFTSLLRRNEIGANSYLLELDGHRIVLDSGMHPKEEGIDSLPAHHELQPNSVDSIFVSHSHLDHSGSLPVLMNGQPDADVYMTPATSKLVDADWTRGPHAIHRPQADGLQAAGRGDRAVHR